MDDRYLGQKRREGKEGYTTWVREINTLKNQCMTKQLCLIHKTKNKEEENMIIVSTI